MAVEAGPELGARVVFGRCSGLWGLAYLGVRAAGRARGGWRDAGPRAWRQLQKTKQKTKNTRSTYEVDGLHSLQPPR